MSKLEVRSQLLSYDSESPVTTDDYIECIGLLSKAISMNPKDFSYYSNRSFVFYKLKRFEFALKDAEMAIKLNDKCPANYIRKASALVALRKFKEAEIAAKHALYLDPGSRDAAYEIFRSRKFGLFFKGFDMEDVMEVIPKCKSIADGFAKLMLWIQIKDI